ncbi:uncharacterized protein BO96DRAFT_384750 [Aspergillus niger CBS 101883]|uniref:uncharacterized protein n=1 Tax=Aspergillus lacticoffeatus (strain CBS 101883) TaxID=1450533 RepID=UPI000D801AD5|nr:uncharacterized protein BO96DRAFT_384750 [Aspergillus niger CBS 101883]PYH60561.1 hypothetical protein BO96DRAFT_384750 [Aspergillus niger CBS 101883]
MSSVGGANDLPGLRGKPVVSKGSRWSGSDEQRRNASDAVKRRGDDIYERGERLTGGERRERRRREESLQYRSQKVRECDRRTKGRGRKKFMTSERTRSQFKSFNTSCFFLHVLSGIVPVEPKSATASCSDVLTSEARTKFGVLKSKALRNIASVSLDPSISQVKKSIYLPPQRRLYPLGTYIHTKASARTMATIMHIGIPTDWCSAQFGVEEPRYLTGIHWPREVHDLLDYLETPSDHLNHVWEDTSFAGITMGARELQHILRSRDAVLHAYNHARRIVAMSSCRPLGGYLPCSKSALLPNPIPVAEKDIPVRQIMSMRMVTYTPQTIMHKILEVRGAKSAVVTTVEQKCKNNAVQQRIGVGIDKDTNCALTETAP